MGWHVLWVYNQQGVSRRGRGLGRAGLVRTARRSTRGCRHAGRVLYTAGQTAAGSAHHSLCTAAAPPSSSCKDQEGAGREAGAVAVAVAGAGAAVASRPFEHVEEAVAALAEVSALQIRCTGTVGGTRLILA